MPTPAPTAAFGPYLGEAAVVPGTIEAEAFDYGGEGVGYLETTPGNSGGVSLGVLSCRSPRPAKLSPGVNDASRKGRKA